ncbi:MAG TPA: helix-turn-helix domain-containing protein [Candidatus Dormibacteraeota bacterium]|nr:helix-turn-helix domain-containing protein [Candidatus Dormibacteraeota bacterium]
MAVADRRERILTQARGLLSGAGRPTVEQIALAAGVSKAGFYREFGSRAALVDALRLDPEPAARDRVLRAALELVGDAGLTALSMDELATRAGVSRATLYRLFPGKPALFVGLVRTFSPLEPVSRVASAMADQPPDVVMPELARTIFRVVAGPGAPGLGLMRSIFFEVSSVSAEAEAAAHELITTILASVGAYLMRQMVDGRLRRMHPVLALQSFVGPIFFHLLTRPLVERVMGLEMDGEQAVTTLAESWLRAMEPDGTHGEGHE